MRWVGRVSFPRLQLCWECCAVACCTTTLVRPVLRCVTVASSGLPWRWANPWRRRHVRLAVGDLGFVALVMSAGICWPGGCQPATNVTNPRDGCDYLWRLSMLCHEGDSKWEEASRIRAAAVAAKSAGSLCAAALHLIDIWGLLVSALGWNLPGRFV